MVVVVVEMGIGAEMGVGEGGHGCDESSCADG